jgi:hypothetical protein
MFPSSFTILVVRKAIMMADGKGKKMENPLRVERKVT